MELVGKKVYRLNLGDYYSVIEFGDEVTLYGFSQDSESLLDDTVKYAYRYKHGEASVSVFRRCSLGASPEIVSKIVL